MLTNHRYLKLGQKFTACNKLKNIWISENEIKKVINFSKDSYLFETGGILVGVMKDNIPWITHIEQIISSKKQYNRYNILKGARPKIISRLRKLDRRIGYIGEWHSHPKNIGLSYIDKQTISRISKDLSANCKSPIIMIIKNSSSGNTIEIKQLLKNRFYKLSYILAGYLPTKGMSI